jgi:hypothetical protein
MANPEVPLSPSGKSVRVRGLLAQAYPIDVAG